MIKKLITISVFLALGVAIGLTGVANAAGDDVVFSAETSVPVYLTGTTNPSDLVVKINSQVATFAADTDKVTITLDTGSDITFESALGKIMSVSCGTGSTFLNGTPSTMQVVYDSACTSVTLTIGASVLTEANVKATPLTAATPSAYTATFRTTSPLAIGDKIKLAFGTGFTVNDSVTAGHVTTLTDDSADITTGITLSSAGGNVINITLASNVAASSVINIVLSSALVTNPASASMTHTAGAPSMPILGIDLYTTTSGGVTIDTLADQTPYNRIIELEPGWNIFAPSQALETPGYGTVILPIVDDISLIYTLTRGTGTMVWETPTNIEPLYGYAIYVTADSTIKLPLDFAKEAPGNFAFSRDLTYQGWFLIGYAGDTAKLNAFANCLDGLVATGVGGTDAYDVIIDLTGKATAVSPYADQTSHFWHASPVEQVNGVGNMAFTKDYGFAISVNTTLRTLTGNRDE